VPKFEEQARIGSLFANLDNLITLHQREYDKTVNIKKAMLEKMFPKDGEDKPEIRFDGFTDAWEQRKLSDIAHIIDGDRGSSYPSGNDFCEQGHTLFLSATNVTADGFSFEDNQFITEEKSNSLGNGKLEPNDVILTSRGSLGHIAWYSRDIQEIIPSARINSGMLILRSTSDYSANYIAQYLKSPLGKSQIDFISFGSAQPQLTKRDISNYKISVPQITEQDSVGLFFSDLDNLITLHQRELKKLQNMKKALLEKMFV
jgi:type I restriction enzyme S subunit